MEGISDRIFFEALFRILKVGQASGMIYEIISVGGKGMFEPYKKLLTACKVPFSIIADLDYINQVGTETIKNLFQVNSKDLCDKVINDPTSIDGHTLLAVMDEAIKTSNLSDLSQLWDYIKSRQRKLRTDLSPEEQELLDQFISEKQCGKKFILSKGTLEAYLPEGYKSKDMDKLIRLVSEENLLKRLPKDGVKELETIIEEIKKS